MALWLLSQIISPGRDAPVPHRRWHNYGKQPPPKYLLQLNYFPQTYFDAERPRTDPIVCLNVLSLFYSGGRGHELANTLEWVLGVLEHRAYLDGTRYYETVECFLYFSARLLHKDKVRDEALHTRLAQLLRERVLERAGCAGDALALAMRMIAGAAVRLRLERDLAALLPLQYEDGGWGPSWIYKYGSSGIKIGNRGLTTALALNAISALYPAQSQSQLQPQIQPQQKQKQEEKKNKKLLLTGESFYTVEITALPLPQLSGRSVIHGWTTTGLSSYPSLPLLEMRRRAENVTLFMTAFVKSVFAFFSPPWRFAITQRGMNYSYTLVCTVQNSVVVHYPHYVIVLPESHFISIHCTICTIR